MTRSLTGKVALVTGAAKGIGAGLAKAMAAAGASVVVESVGHDYHVPRSTEAFRQQRR